jgi:hypothetical protein
MMTEAEKKVWESHRWEDVSYHGSPTYQCSLCNTYEYDKAAKRFCPKLAETLEREAEQQEKAERAEYDRYIREAERIQYLKSKYEGKS